MVNENIVTALHNAVERGEQLDQAINILVNSGYNAQEVREASQFVGQGAIPLLETKRDEQLLPTQNIVPLIPTASPTSFLKKLHFFKTPTTESPSQKSTQANQETTTPEKPKKKYTTEIILVVVLLLLMGILIGTIIFKDTILSFLSG